MRRRRSEKVDLQKLLYYACIVPTFIPLNLGYYMYMSVLRALYL